MKLSTVGKTGTFMAAGCIIRRALTLFFFAFLITLVARAQTTQTPEAISGQILGTVTDLRGDAVSGATVVLTGPDTIDTKTMETGQNGFFEFDDAKPGISYQLSIKASGFADWTSGTINISPGQVSNLGGIPLQLASQNTSVTVTGDPFVIATEQIKAEEKQRVFGLIPNFYVSYEGENAAPLTAKMKFKLALKVSYDPVTIAGVGLVAAFRQAAHSPDYREGAIGYAERFGQTGGDGFIDIMIGGAILPSLLHQDPRYFYQGTGSTGSRLRHALLSPFIAKGDNGRWQPNYSSLGGDLISGAIANLYFPRTNRGGGLVLSQFAIGTGERMLASVAQEFLLGRVTHRSGHMKDASLQQHDWLDSQQK